MPSGQGSHLLIDGLAYSDLKPPQSHFDVGLTATPKSLSLMVVHGLVAPILYSSSMFSCTEIHGSLLY